MSEIEKQLSDISDYIAYNDLPIQHQSAINMHLDNIRAQLAATASEPFDKEIEAGRRTIMRLSALLSEIAIALKGPEGDGQQHSFHDLPELARSETQAAAQLAAPADRNAVLEEAAAECERMKMFPGGRQETSAHYDVWAAAKAIRALKASHD